jgi:biopolymer transport protein ExbB
MTRLRLLSAMMLTVGSLWATAANAWWNDEWAFRKEITLDTTPAAAAIAGSESDVPVLIRLSIANFQYFADAKPDGSDLRFLAADDKTPLKFHIERYDSQAQVALVWVRIPRITGAANTDKVFLYYGNKAATNAADAGGTYDTAQALVYHFATTKADPQDSTAYKSEPGNFGAEITPTALIGSGATFAGAQTIAVPATGAVRLQKDKGLTISAWVRIAAPQTDAIVAQLADGGRELALAINGSAAVARYTGGSAPVVVTQSGAGLTPNEWHFVALRIAGGQLALLVDGAEAGSAAAELADLGGALTIGGAAAGGSFLQGDIDELQIATAGRSNDWLAAAARSQGMVASLVVYGGDSQKEGGGESYITSTLRNVTVDGWVIIGILSLLFVASVIIMAGKTWLLSRIASGNARFLEEFGRMNWVASELPAAPGGGTNSFGGSTLWQLYKHGMGETLKRFEGQAAGADRARVLSPQSIEAIRATMDASMTRETQRLNAQMVWLTISISGGPFLGLLGTVVGVMITFAAIAASGEVNINAIAPGTAAALVATVAGLGVAIPCLFGYNYLSSKIKEIAADMRVFNDEFVTRIAETYS